MFYLYILQSTQRNIYYVGYSANPWRRLKEHNTNPTDSFTSKFRPWRLKAIFECGPIESAAKRIERFIKRQKSRKLIEKLIQPAFVPSGILAQLVRVPDIRE